MILGAALIAFAPSGWADGTNSDSLSKPDSLKTCPVSGDKLGADGKPYVFSYQGQEVKLCCKDCKKDFDKNPEKYMAMIQAGDAKPDLLTTCPVSGEKLAGDMGEPFVFAYKGQEVKLCCKDCKEKFDKNPAKYIAKIRAADKAGKVPPEKMDKN